VTIYVVAQHTIGECSSNLGVFTDYQKARDCIKAIYEGYTPWADGCNDKIIECWQKYECYFIELEQWNVE
jgi:hypothetical protein